MTGKQVSLEFLDLADNMLTDKDGLRTLTKDNEGKQMNYVKEVQILEMLFIQYVFLNDDGKISFTEKLVLKNYYHKFKDVFSVKDIEYINNSLESVNMVQNIKDFIKVNKIKNAVISHVVNNISKKYLSKKRYKDLIVSLEQNFLN